MSRSEERSFEVRQAPDTLAKRSITHVTIGALFTMTIALVAAWSLVVGARASSHTVLESPHVAPRTIGTLEQSLIFDTARGRDLRRSQRSALERWTWVDRDAGLVDVPIGKAVDLLLARPIAEDRPFDPAAPSSTTGAPAPPPEGAELLP